jgi:hypothetical protein
LRALWTIWSVEVRILSGALRKPRYTRGFLVSSADTSDLRKCAMTTLLAGRLLRDTGA